MKISRNWLQKFFAAELPSAEALADALTFHVFEIEEVEQKGNDAVLDVKVLPDRAAYGLSHRGVAYELSAILGVPLKEDPLRAELPDYATNDQLDVQIEDARCARYVGALIRGVKVGPSPAWLKEALEAVGQRSINNVVDATNYVMLNIGQPLHAFDAARLQEKSGTYAIGVRGAKKDEKITSLSGDEYTLPEGTLLIVDEHADGAPLGIAGVKGGKAAEVSNDTADIIIESANFDGTSVRRASQALRLWTDASLRFQNRPSPELAAYGMRDVVALIHELAGGELVTVRDIYPQPQLNQNAAVSVSLDRINGILGTAYSAEQVAGVFDRLGFIQTTEGETFTVTAPFERRDVVIPEDLVEEVGRIIGYEDLPAAPLPPIEGEPNQLRYRGIERIKDQLISQGFTEISTQSFYPVGDIYLANPLDQSRPALRTTLTNNMAVALARAAVLAPRVLGTAKQIKLFEIGTIFPKEGEQLSLVLGYKQLTGKQSASALEEQVSILEESLGGLQFIRNKSSDITDMELETAQLEKLGADYQPKRVTLGAYVPFTQYPFALRDIAVWTPVGTEMDEVSNFIIKEAGPLLARIDLFDKFEKDSRISYAFRLVFESNERTLSDEDLNPTMEKVTKALNANEGWEVR